nr:WYL domain-containing protein [Kordiimonas marina]
MQVRINGISYREIEEALGICHRSAQRNIQACRTAFPQLEEFKGIDGEARWRLPRNVRIPIPEATPEDLAALDGACHLLENHGRNAEAEAVKKIASLFRYHLKNETLRRLEPDYDSLVSADAIAAQPGPKQRINPEILSPLKEAIKGYNQIAIEYQKNLDKPAECHVVEPYGLLYGHRNYLVARNPSRQDDRLRHYALPKLLRVEVLSSSFVRPEDFRMRDYARSFFGVYSEAASRTVWRFSPKAVPHAIDFEFHPDQKLTREDDGSLTVEFTAGGLQEMAWHLMIWGMDVEVIEPQELRELVQDNRPNWAILP